MIVSAMCLSALQSGGPASSWRNAHVNLAYSGDQKYSQGDASKNGPELPITKEIKVRDRQSTKMYFRMKISISSSLISYG